MTPSFFFCAIYLLGGIVFCLVMMARKRADFEERYPPISDAEYLARCSPGVNPAIALKVREIVAEHFGIPYERVHPSIRFVDDLE